MRERLVKRPILAKFLSFNFVVNAPKNKESLSGCYRILFKENNILLLIGLDN